MKLTTHLKITTHLKRQGLKTVASLTHGREFRRDAAMTLMWAVGHQQHIPRSGGAGCSFVACLPESANNNPPVPGLRLYSLFYLPSHLPLCFYVTKAKCLHDCSRNSWVWTAFMLGAYQLRHRNPEAIQTRG